MDIVALLAYDDFISLTDTYFQKKDYNMKKFLLIGMCAILAGCASTGPAKKATDVSPMGVIAVMAVNDITWYGEEKKSAGLLGNLVEKAVDKAIGENAEMLLPSSEKALFEACKKNSVQMVDSSKILNAEEYRNAKEDKFTKGSGLIVPGGYRYVTNKDTVLLKQLVTTTGMKSGLYVNFNFQKVMKTGVSKNGVANACVTMNVVLVDANGKAIRQKSYYAASKDTFSIVAGAYKPDSLMALFPDAINQVCEKFAVDFSK